MKITTEKSIFPVPVSTAQQTESAGCESERVSESTSKQSAYEGFQRNLVAELLCHLDLYYYVNIRGSARNV